MRLADSIVEASEFWAVAASLAKTVPFEYFDHKTVNGLALARKADRLPSGRTRTAKAWQRKRL